MSISPIRILLVDDHAIARGGIKLMLEIADDMHVAGQATSMSDALDFVIGRQIDVAIVDISMPGQDGFQLLNSFKRHRPEIAVLMLSGHAEEMYGLRALKLGAAGYLNKAVCAPDLIAAVRKAARGGTYYSAALCEMLVRQTQGAKTADMHSLSQRELGVLMGLAAGQSLTAIANALCLSPKTISTYRARVLDKLGMQCNAQLTRYAMDEGLI